MSLFVLDIKQELENDPQAVQVLFNQMISEINAMRAEVNLLQAQVTELIIANP